MGNFTNLGSNIQQTRDEFGSEADERKIVKIKQETGAIEELSTIVKTRDISTDSIYDNGRLYDTTWNYDDTYDNSLVVQRVVNPNNTFKEYFRDTTFKSASTDATWNVTTHRLTFGSGSVAQSTVIAANSETYTTVLLSMSGTTSSLTPKISFNGGNTFETISANVSYSTATSGTALAWRLESNTVQEVTSLQIQYS